MAEMKKEMDERDNIMEEKKEINGKVKNVMEG